MRAHLAAALSISWAEHDPEAPQVQLGHRLHIIGRLAESLREGHCEAHRVRIQKVRWGGGPRAERGAPGREAPGGQGGPGEGGPGEGGPGTARYMFFNE